MSRSQGISATDSPGFLPRFVALAVLAGTTIGMGNVITTLFALHIGASSFQVGLISGSATLGMMLVTLPAGFLIARFGARRVYLLASLNCAIVYVIVPWITFWPLLAGARGIVGASVPFRTISMNSTFLARIREFGIGKAGWYRAAQSSGMAVIGPWLGTLVTGSASFLLAYLCLAAMFAFMAAWSQNFLPTDAPTPPVAPAGGVIAEIRQMLGDVWVGETCLTEFVSSSATSVFSSFIIVLAVKELGWSAAQAVVLITTQGLSLILALFLLGPVLAKLPLGFAYVGSICCASAALLLIGLGQTLPVLMAGAVSLAIGAALIHLVNTHRLAAAPWPKSKLSSLLNLSSQAGSLTGSLLGGLASLVFGLHLLFLVWIPVLWLIAAACFWRARAVSRRAMPA